MNKQSVLKKMAAVFAVALAIRVLVVLWLYFAPPQYQPSMAIFTGDAKLYDALARSLASGQGYQLEGNFREFTRVPPLFPCFIALQYLLWGGGVLGAGLCNALLGAITAALLFVLALHCFSFLPRPDPRGNLQHAKIFRYHHFAPDTASGLYHGFGVRGLSSGSFQHALCSKGKLLDFPDGGFCSGLGAHAHNARFLCCDKGFTTKGAYGLAFLTGALLGLSVLSRLVHVGFSGAFYLGEYLAAVAVAASQSKNRQSAPQSDGKLQSSTRLPVGTAVY
jgi:hypothetical protein